MNEALSLRKAGLAAGRAQEWVQWKDTVNKLKFQGEARGPGCLSHAREFHGKNKWPQMTNGPSSRSSRTLPEKAALPT